MALVLLLICASVLALQSTIPTFVQAKQGLTQSLVTISVCGQAFSMENQSAASVRLILTGISQDDGNNLKIDGLDGILQIGSTNYTISTGQGELHETGTIGIRADVSDKNRNMELLLLGSNQNGNLVFDVPQSKLASQYFLYLSGQLLFNNSLPTTHSSSLNFTDIRSENVGKIETVTIAEFGQNYTVIHTIMTTQTGTNSIQTVMTSATARVTAASTATNKSTVRL